MDEHELFGAKRDNDERRPARHEGDATDGSDCAEDTNASESENVKAAAEEQDAERKESGGYCEDACLPAHGEDAGGEERESVIHLEARRRLEGAESACVKGVAEGVRACGSGDDGDEAEDGGDGDC